MRSRFSKNVSAVGVDLERIVIVAEQGRLHFGHEPFDMLAVRRRAERVGRNVFRQDIDVRDATRVHRAQPLDHQTESRKLLRARLVDQEESAQRRMIAVVGQRRVQARRPIRRQVVVLAGAVVENPHGQSVPRGDVERAPIELRIDRSPHTARRPR
jgi:hypothetical protein